MQRHEVEELISSQLTPLQKEISDLKGQIAVLLQ